MPKAHLRIGTLTLRPHYDDHDDDDDDHDDYRTHCEALKREL